MTYSLLRQDCRFECYTAMLVYGVSCDALKSGAPLHDVQPPIRVTLSAYGTQRSDILELPALVVSDAMRVVLERTGIDNVQYFKAELQQEYRDEIIHGYWVANVVGLVACVDALRSHWQGEAMAEGSRLLDFHIDPNETHGLSVFRLAEDPRLVVVSDRVRRSLEAARLRGLIFQDPRTYDGYPVDTSRQTETHVSIADAGEDAAHR